MRGLAGILILLIAAAPVRADDTRVVELDLGAPMPPRAPQEPVPASIPELLGRFAVGFAGSGALLGTSMFLFDNPRLMPSSLLIWSVGGTFLDLGLQRALAGDDAQFDAWPAFAATLSARLVGSLAVTGIFEDRGARALATLGLLVATEGLLVGLTERNVQATGRARVGELRIEVAGAVSSAFLFDGSLMLATGEVSIGRWTGPRWFGLRLSFPQAQYAASPRLARTELNGGLVFVGRWTPFPDAPVVPFVGATLGALIVARMFGDAGVAGLGPQVGAEFGVRIPDAPVDWVASLGAAITPIQGDFVKHLAFRIGVAF